MKEAGYSGACSVSTNDIASLRTKEHACYLGWLAFLYTLCECGISVIMGHHDYLQCADFHSGEDLVAVVL